MALYGADSEQLRSLSKTVSQAADHLSQAGSQVTSQLGSTRWTGPDGDRFRSQWNSSSMASLRAAAQELRTAAAALQRNAQEQDQASAASGGGGGALGITLPDIAKPFDVSHAPHVTDATIYDAAGLALDGKGLLDDSKTLHDAVNGVTDVAHTGAGSDVLGAAGVALDAQDLGKRWQGIEDGNMGDFLGGLLDVGGAAASVGGMVVPEAAVPLAGFDLGITGLGAGLDDLEKGK